MKAVFSRMLALVPVFLISACASAPQMLTVPVSSSPLSYTVGPNPIVEKSLNHMTKALDDKNTVIYQQMFGGGGVGLGLLGPFGVAANIAMIGNKTDADVAVLRGKIQVDPQAVFSEISADYPALAAGADSAKAVRISPLFNVVRQKDDKLQFGCSILVDYTATGTQWTGKYVYQFPVEYTLEHVSQGLSAEEQHVLADQAKTGFRALTKLYLDDANGKLVAKRDFLFKSSFLAPRFDFQLTGQELPAEDGQVNIRSVGAVYSLPKNQVTIVN
jgi:hypothetical protein